MLTQRYLTIDMDDLIQESPGQLRLKPGMVLLIGTGGVFLPHQALVTLRDNISNHLEAHSCPRCHQGWPDGKLCSECAAEENIENRDARETGADRCPPRE